MKKCPACNRTYGDETLSFCLEDGSLLSASFNLYEEPETVVRSGNSDIAPPQFYSPATDARGEMPTVVSAKNTISENAASNTGLFILFGVIGFGVLATIYTASVLPMIIPLLAGLFYLAQMIYKKIK